VKRKKYENNARENGRTPFDLDNGSQTIDYVPVKIE